MHQKMVDWDRDRDACVVSEHMQPILTCTVVAIRKRMHDEE